MMVRQLMRPAIPLSTNTDRATALRCLLEADQDALVLTDERGRAEGVLTRKDLAEPGLEPTFVALRPFVPLRDADPVDRAVHLMLRHGVHHLAVVRDERPVGLLSREHILDAMRDDSVFGVA